MPPLNGPLDGIRVLDLGRYQAGPRCGLMLARLGAEVIKVERPQGDESRENGPVVRGQSAYWVQYNSGKKSLTLDLRKEQGKEVLRGLVKLSDVFIQNFRPGVIDRMEFGYEALEALNPRIIMVNISAYGQYGPYWERPGFDPIGQAVSGLMSLTGFPETPPTRSYANIIDRITALHAAIGALAALRERELSGRGQAIDVSLADTGFTLMEIPIAAYLGAGVVPKRAGNRGDAPPSNAYRCRDGWVFIFAIASDMWPNVCRALGREEWIEEPRYRTRPDRAMHVEEIDAGIEAWCQERTVQEVVEACSREGVPAAPVNDLPQAARDPQVAARELLVEVPDPVAGSIHVAGKMIKLSRTEMVVGPAPSVGQHSEEVLKGLLGYGDEQVAALRREGVL